MAGEGKRTRVLGKFKPFINISGKEISSQNLKMGWKKFYRAHYLVKNLEES